jgi:lysostaphin
MTGTPSEQFHPGVDLGASLGSPVYAVDDGTVVASYLSVGRETDKSKAYYGWGNRIVLRHDSADHPFTEYNHMMIRTAQQAESVVKGQIIGFVGSTGASTGPHLHFGVVAVDPQTTAYAESNYIDPTNLIG